MKVYVVSLTKDGRWHCFGISGDIPFYPSASATKYYEKIASKLIRDLVIGSENPWHRDRDKYMIAYATHAPTRYRAIGIAKAEYKRRLIK